MASILDNLVTVLDFETGAGLRQLNRFERGIRKAQRSMNSMAHHALRAGAAITGAAVGALVPYAQFEAKMAKIEALVGTNREQLQAWYGDLDRITRTYGSNMAELTDSLFDLLSAGVPVDQALKNLELSAKGAASGLGEARTLADLTTSAMGAYGAENFKVAQSYDQLVAAIREGKIANPEALAGPVASVLPFAAQLNIEFGELLGLFAALSRQGIAPNRAASAVRGILSKFVKPTTQGLDVLEEHLDASGKGFDTLKQAIADKGLMHALLSMKTAFGDNDQAFGKFFEDVEGLAGVLALTGSATQANLGIIGRVVRDVGALDKAFEVMAKTLMTNWDIALDSLYNNLVDIGRLLAPLALAILDIVQGASNWFAGLSDGAKSTVAAVLTLGPVLVGIGVSLKLLAFGLGGLLPILRLLRIAVWSLFGPWGTLLAIASIVAVSMIDDWSKVGDFFVDMWGKIIAGINWVLDKMGLIGNAIRDVWSAVPDFLLGGDADVAINNNGTLAAPLPVGPVPALPGGGAGQAGNKVDVEVGQIVINAEGSDAREIAGAVGQELRKEVRSAVEQADSQVKA